MKMAKASERDMEMAKDLCTALESLERGFMPPDARAPDDEDNEDFDSEDSEHCYRALQEVLRLVRRGSIGRVVWGMATLLHPANKVVDQGADTLEDHPDVAQAKADSARLRWLTEDHDDADTRARCRELLSRMGVMSYSAATAAIDDAMRECAAVGAA